MADKDNGKVEGLRLQVYLAKAGIGSRRKCEEFISEGRVAVNGEQVFTQGIRIVDQNVTFDGRPVYPAKKMVYIALNKPVRYLCTASDPEGRSTAIELVRKAWPGRIYNVGRLDFMSSGLIFFTNDGEFTKSITHPASGILKTYTVETREDIPKDMLDEWKHGVSIEGVRYKIEEYEIKTNKRVTLTLREGKNREIRNLFNSKRFKIKKLHRIRIGSVSIGGLRPGEYRFLTETEVKKLLKSGVHKK
ncbi:MAG: pseudouridine synthase [Spirochaetales bacterium]|uniref:Pseudouridine synthase n=1 Tax=Candidatus Thalassospirochaeta sargassi TaxID=3119039 RepID=A0AAJ1MMZ9_9SPIO|nr:pseudouridine synthase [Spirochaetales bacterium]